MWEFKNGFSFQVLKHILPMHNSKLALATPTQIPPTAPCNPQWAFKNRVVITETPTHYSTTSAAGDWNSLPSEQRPENKLDITELIAGTLI